MHPEALGSLPHGARRLTICEMPDLGPPDREPAPEPPSSPGNERSTGHRAGNSRDAALDLLRAIALGRVVVWHTVAATWLTVFAAIPLMFFVAGSLLGSSLDGRSYPSLVLRRARRLLLPLWLYGAVVAAVGASQAHVDGVALSLDPLGLVRGLSWVLPLVDPVESDWHAGWLSGHLWYLRAYLWIVLLAPVLAMFARRLVLSVPILVLLVVQLEVARSFGVPGLAEGQARVVIGDFVTYGLFAVLGLAYSRYRPTLNRRLLGAGAVACGAGAATYAAMAGLPEGGLNASYPAILLTGAAWLLAAGAAEPPLRRLAEMASVRRATSAIGRRAVTIYLWHPVAIVVSYAALEGRTPSPTVFALLLTPVLTAFVVLAVGFVEDIAAGRLRAPLPRWRWPTLRGAAFAPTVVAVLVVATPLIAEPFVADPVLASVAGPPAGTRRPPSYRVALGSTAFAGNGAAIDQRPLRLKHGRMPVRQLQRALDRWRKAHPDVQLAAVALTVEGKGWFGQSNAEGVAPMGMDEPYKVASLTKVFTGTLVMRAAEFGAVKLDAPMPRLAGIRVPRALRGITPRQLLQHTSGLVDYLNAHGYHPSLSPTPQQAVNMALSTPLVAPPGTKVHYSNTNYLYLGLLLEQLTGRLYEELVAELVGGISLPGIFVHPDGGPGRVGHASGGVRASLPDLVRYADALYTPGRVLPRRWIDQMMTLDRHNLGLGTWPLCPCWTDLMGRKRYSAIGHHVGHGGLYRNPAGMTIAIRVEPPSKHTGAQVEGLHQLLLAVLR
jgi:CubicO group peptidase (beta-lactamase class C family)/peptidoglycan/LPS O-acetylase OafA/YrhL